MMKLKFFASFLAFLLTITGSVDCQNVSAANRNSESERELLRVEREYLDARVRNDKAAPERILADDFVSTNADGKTGDRANTLANANVALGGARILSQDIDDVRVRVYGKSGIITGRRLIRTENGERQVRFTHLFIKRRGKWRLAASHVSAIRVT